MTDPVAQIDHPSDVLSTLEAMIAANRVDRSTEAERTLIQLRHRAASAVTPNPRLPWPPTFEDPFPDVTGTVPEIPAHELTAEVMGATIAHHGSLIVRGLLDPDAQARTAATIIEATDAAQKGAAGQDDGWYDPVLGDDSMASALRKKVEDLGGVWLADSPRGTAQVLDDLTASGAMAAVAGHFGERPVFSLQKSTLRRVPPEFRYTGWHQDGSFLGEGTRALNIWVALTACGGDRPAPGLEVIPARIENILETDGVARASIDGYAVHYSAKSLGVTVDRPLFDPGDAILFDERMAHRTFLAETMTEERLALECWFFSPAHPNSEYISLLA